MSLRVAVVIPTARLGDHLTETLFHLAAQTLAPSAIVVVADEPGVLDFVHPALRVVVCGPAAPNRKRFLGALAVEADLVACIDDDAYPRSDWLAAAVAAFADPSVTAAGGPALTPPDDAPRARAGGAVFASRLVTATSVLRYVPRPARDVAELPACNLVVRRGPFLAAVRGALDLWPCEDSALCDALSEAGGRIRYEPGIVVYHRRRALFAPHLAQVWRYAQARGALARRGGASRTPAYAIPTAFVAGHGAALTCALAHAAAGVAAATVLGAAYLAGVGIAVARAPRGTPRLAVAAGIYLTHLAYGCGYAAGALSGSRAWASPRARGAASAAERCADSPRSPARPAAASPDPSAATRSASARDR